MLPSKRVNFRPSPTTGGLELDGEWAKMDLAINVLRKSDVEELVEGVADEEVFGRNTRRKLINQDIDTPFCRVRHDIKVALKLSWLPEPHASELAAKLKRCSGSGERIRKLRAAHRERRTETLVFNVPVKYAQVSEGVEKVYRTLGVHHGAPVAALSTAPTAIDRSASPVPSLTTSSGGTSAGSTPASGILPLPSCPSLSITSSSSGASSMSQDDRSSCGSDIGNPMPYVLVASSSSFFTGPFILPPYSELYHSNGDRKELLEGLPPYVPKLGHSEGGLALTVSA